jgi:hypothetical protein
MTRDEVELVRSRIGAQGKSDVEKWFDIYRILFPNDRAKEPSPCKYFEVIKLRLTQDGSNRHDGSRLHAEDQSAMRQQPERRLVISEE